MTLTLTLTELGVLQLLYDPKLRPGQGGCRLQPAGEPTALSVVTAGRRNGSERKTLSLKQLLRDHVLVGMVLSK